MDPNYIITALAAVVSTLAGVVFRVLSVQVSDQRAELKEKDARYATIVPALENFGRGSEAVVAAVSDLDSEIDGFGTRLDELERQHASQIEALKAHYKIEMDALRADITEVVRVVGDLQGDVRVTAAAVERISREGSGPWRSAHRPAHSPARPESDK